jgi:hypothetical protein
MNAKHIRSFRRLGRRLLGTPQLTLEEMPDDSRLEEYGSLAAI